MIFPISDQGNRASNSSSRIGVTATRISGIQLIHMYSFVSWHVTQVKTPKYREKLCFFCDDTCEKFE